ncbi:hypothetical protein Tco_0328584 [Tanacetum coccineum]
MIWFLRLWTRDKLEKTPSYLQLTKYKVTKLDSTEKLMNKIGELRAISTHVIGASGVQIPQDHLDNQRSTEEEEEEEGETEVLDPQDVSGSVLLEITNFAIFGFLLEPLVYMHPRSPKYNISYTDSCATTLEEGFPRATL